MKALFLINSFDELTRLEWVEHAKIGRLISKQENLKVKIDQIQSKQYEHKNNLQAIQARVRELS